MKIVVKKELAAFSNKKKVALVVLLLIKATKNNSKYPKRVLFQTKAFNRKTNQTSKIQVAFKIKTSQKA